jgi:predicted RNase H-like HicB family nuclease
VKEDAMRASYTVLIYQQNDDYTVTVPALPGCVTWGRTLDEAATSAREAIAVYIETLQANGKEVPIEDGSPFILTITQEIEAPISTH